MYFSLIALRARLRVCLIAASLIPVSIAMPVMSMP